MPEHLDSKNGKKDGASGSSFFTWFMVIALLGVWTSVAVVWFDLVDYEEVLGKLGIYDADGDGDFDVDDAKVLLGHDPGVVAKPRSKAEVRESIKAQLMKAKEKLKIKRPKVEDKGKPKKEKEESGKKHAAAEKSKKDSGKGKEEKHQEKPGGDRERRHKENTRPSRGKDDGKERESSRTSRRMARVLRNSGKEDDEKKRKGVH